MEDPMPLPMHIRRTDAELYHALLLSIERRGKEPFKSEGTFIRQQLELHASYVNACAKIEAFADEVRNAGACLVQLRFPIRLTQKTRESVESGMHRSFHRFLQDLHGAVIAQHAGALDDSVTQVEPFLVRLANALTLESCRILDGKVPRSEARTVCITYAERLRLETVRDECRNMDSLFRACQVAINCLNRFNKEQARIGKDVVPRMRAFLHTAERRGLRNEALRLRQDRQARQAIAKHVDWMHDLGNAFDDERIERVHELLALTHVELTQALRWQQARVTYLKASNVANCAWCGVSLSTGVDGTLLHAPAHMRVFMRDERVRLVLDKGDVPFAHYLSTVAVANLVIELLHRRWLQLHQIDSGYANRVMTYDFCKYETAARSILEDTVGPWAERTKRHFSK
jgi:hypothetical protein